jgi:hypothetical protein
MDMDNTIGRLADIAMGKERQQKKKDDLDMIILDAGVEEMVTSHFEQRRPGSLDVVMDKQSFKELSPPTPAPKILIDQQSGLQVPAGKLEEIKAWVAKMRKKHPNMKPDRLQRKCAEHFHLKFNNEKS